MSTSSETQQCEYQLEFAVSAKEEWDKLDPVIRRQFATKLKIRLSHPHVAKDKLKGMPGCYKIKLRASGYRLVYEVQNAVVLVTELAVGKREQNKVYTAARKRLSRK